MTGEARAEACAARARGASLTKPAFLKRAVNLEPPSARQEISAPWEINPYKFVSPIYWKSARFCPDRAEGRTRRALAAGIRRSTCSAAEATYAERCDDQPAADPACCFECPVDPAPAEQ